MKFKINLSGKGGECYLFPLTDEQLQYLSDNEVENDNMDIDEIQSYLKIEDIGESNLIVTGPYAESDTLYITVEDEDGNQIFNSEDDDELLDIIFENSNWIGTEYDNQDFLAIEDYVKGNFYSFEIELDEPFEADKLSLVITELAESREIVSNILYDGRELDKEWGDYWSKGFYFFLNRV